MAYDRFLIGPLQTGLQTDLKPWLIQEDAFEELSNAYVFRGRVRKRFGSLYTGSGGTAGQLQLRSRLRIALTGGAKVGTTDGAGDATGTVPGTVFTVGQMFSIGTTLYTVVLAGVPAAMIKTDATAVCTYNTTTGVYVFTGAPATTQIYFYPSTPVMGLTLYAGGVINNETAYAFDQQFAYSYNGNYWVQEITGTPIWHGNNTNYFWATNWQGVTSELRSMFVTNFQVTNKNGAVVAAKDDPIWSFDGTTWATFMPLSLVAGDKVKTARIILPFKGRLLLLNTVEANAADTVNTWHPSRCRFSHNGSPFPANTAWLEPNQVGADGAGWLDAATDEQIVSAAFIKDRLIVYFEQSTWELVYLGDQAMPFVWQRINDELGSEATFSSVVFDKAILTVGQTGIHACSGANVERIDTKIPDEVFNIADKTSSVLRIAGIRDYYTEMVYWTFPSSVNHSSHAFPNRVLVYNYRNDSWAFNDDCLTCFGYYYQQIDRTWAEMRQAWQTENTTWNSGVINANARRIIAGNQQGYVMVIDPDTSRNAGVMQISNIVNYSTGANITVYNHGFEDFEYAYIENAVGSGGFSLSGIFQVVYVDQNTFGIITPITGTYTGGGTVARVSQIRIRSKEWNPYNKDGRNVHLDKIDFLVQRTAVGQITASTYISSSEWDSLLVWGQATGSILGTGILETSGYVDVPQESQQERVWHAVFFQTTGTCAQLLLSLEDSQMRSVSIACSDFQLEGLILYCKPGSVRVA